MAELRAKLPDAVREEVNGSLKELRDTTRENLANIQKRVGIALGAGLLGAALGLYLVLTR